MPSASNCSREGEQRGGARRVRKPGRLEAGVSLDASEQYDPRGQRRGGANDLQHHLDLFRSERAGLLPGLGHAAPTLSGCANECKRSANAARGARACGQEQRAAGPLGLSEKPRLS